jgi:hypothetical protein
MSEPRYYIHGQSTRDIRFAFHRTSRGSVAESPERRPVDKEREERELDEYESGDEERRRR